MYKLKYTLLLTIVMYTTSSLAMTRTAELGRRTASQLGQRAATNTSRFTPTVTPTFNRPYTTSTAPVVPTWQQTPATQRVPSGVQPLTADSTNRSLAAAQASYKRGSGGSSFWERYNKYGLSAAVAGFWATNKAESKEMSDEEKIAALQKTRDQSYEKAIHLCSHYHKNHPQIIDTIRLTGNDAANFTAADGTTTIFRGIPRILVEVGPSNNLLKKIKSESPNCADALMNFYSAEIDLLQEKIRQTGDQDQDSLKEEFYKIIGDSKVKQRWLK